MADSKFVMKSLLKNNILCIVSKSKELIQAGLENSAQKTEQNKMHLLKELCGLCSCLNEEHWCMSAECSVYFKFINV